MSEVSAKLYFDDAEIRRQANTVEDFSLNGWTKLSPIRWTTSESELAFFADIGITRRNLSEVKHSKKIGVLLEPLVWTPGAARAAVVLRNHFDAILTYDDNLLALGKPFIPYIPGGIQLSPDEPFLLEEKTHDVSISVSAKRTMEGHKLRHEVVRALGSNDSLTVMGQGYKPYINPGEPHNRFRFSIVIENTRSKHNLTEKLLHSYLFKCVPIYWGAEIANHHFRGLLNFETMEDLEKLLPNLTPDFYNELESDLEENFFRAQELMSKEVNFLRTLSAYKILAGAVAPPRHSYQLRTGEPVESGRDKVSSTVSIGLLQRLNRLWKYKFQYFWHPATWAIFSSRRPT